MQQAQFLGKQKNGANAKMKVLYLGHYKEGTGWSDAAINNILALNKQDVDLVTRNVRLTKEVPVPQEILELEKKDLQNIDVCIQHVLPHHLVGTTKFKKNIAYFVNETNTIKYASNWLQLLQMMDEVWVPCERSKTNLHNDGIENVQVVPHTFDMSDYKIDNTMKASNLVDENFKFYYIGEHNDRKNLENIIRCFHVAFSPSEPVDLVLKVNAGAYQDVDSLCTHVKKQLRLYNNMNTYKKENIIPKYLSRQEILNFHNVCDCYLSTSHGEAWNIPAFEAMAFGNTPICSAYGGPEDFIDKDDKNTGTLIRGAKKIANHQNPAFGFLATGREMWFEPDDEHTIETMRYYFENRNKKDVKPAVEQAEKFSYENIGKLMQEFLQ